MLGRMLEFTEEQRSIQSAIRAWCKKELEPKVAALEAGTESVYPVMRAMGAAFGIAEVARAALSRLEARAPDGKGEGSPRKRGGGAGPLTAILMMELSRVCPGFAMAFGASTGLFGGAVMARGTAEQRERWALPVLSLEKIGAWGLTEPGRGATPSDR